MSKKFDMTKSYTKRGFIEICMGLIEEPNISPSLIHRLNELIAWGQAKNDNSKIKFERQKDGSVAPVVHYDVKIGPI
jgi:hypothetical protein